MSNQTIEQKTDNEIEIIRLIVCLQNAYAEIDVLRSERNSLLAVIEWGIDAVKGEA